MTEPTATPMVKSEGVHKYFGRLEVLKGINLQVMPGEVMCVIGPSGSGKSTLCRAINRQAVGRRRARRLPAEGRQALRAARQ
jgi:polar amino acid transport system ATP-binding protein